MRPTSNTQAFAQQDLDNCTSLIKQLVAQAIRRGQFQPTDRFDLEQSLWVKLLKRRLAFQAERSSWPTFLNRVLKGEIVTQLNHRYAAKRHPAREQPVVDTVAQKAPDHPTQEVSPEVQEILTLAPQELQQLAQRLLDGDSLTRAGKALGLSPTATRRLARQLRERFETCGFGGTA